jgi:tetratricopeptide (TPR) repeat protein
MKLIEMEERFIRHIAANLDYWQERTRDLGRKDVSALDPDRQNIFRAVVFGLRYRQTWRETAHLMLQSWLFIERRGYWREWIPLLDQALAKCDDEWSLKCQLLNRLGHCHRLTGQWADAIANLQEAKSIARKQGDDLLVARANHFLSSVYLHKMDYARAERCGLEALDMLTRLAPETAYLATNLNELGQIARWQGDYALAEERYSAAIALWRKLDNVGDLATSMLNLAEALHGAGRFEEALPYYQEAITLLSAAGSELRKVLVQTNLGALYYHRGDYATAENTFRQVDLAYLRRIGNIHYQAVVANGLGNVLLAQGRLEAAESYLRQSQSFWLQLDEPIQLGNTVGTLAETLAAKGDVSEALHLYDDACQLLSAYPDRISGRKLLDSFTVAREALIENKED